MTQVHLDWQGPHSLATDDGRRDFNPPSESGVYLWCVGRHPNHRISYVGEAGDLQQRLYEHIFWTLGGAYCLYADDHMVDGKSPVDAYKPGLGNILTVFLGDFPKYSAMAHQNLLGYTFFWATVPGDRAHRRAVESALIANFRDAKEPLQNARVSVSAADCKKLSVASKFKPDFKMPAVPPTLFYGTLD